MIRRGPRLPVCKTSCVRWELALRLQDRSAHVVNLARRGKASLSYHVRCEALRSPAGVVGGVVGAVATKVTELGLSFLARVTDLKGYSLK